MKKLTTENFDEQIAKSRIDWSDPKVLDNIELDKLNTKDIMKLMLSCVDDMNNTCDYFFNKLQVSKKKNIKEITETLAEYDFEMDNLEKLIQSNVTTKTRFNKIKDFDQFSDDQNKLRENILALQDKIERSDSFDK